ncbi:hypothetical protein [Costertonia aggregata]|uniref:Cellobiose phosphorylase n=1 Tax=Costertonia aggregata TaxID=343403 RepID=A0A7H9ASP3_9FLAO|nr:hypothetical protein [Costertonia aggregata]QLG46215.1 hypothetical protein HYG79_12950 [Costertonia aggregata]
MSKKDIHIGGSRIKSAKKEVVGEIVQFENENYYKISNYDAMRSFFMSIVSPSNHWIFISSNGGLTAGRQNSESALFPYYTDDKIAESSSITGSKTMLHIHKEEKTYLWEPFSYNYIGIYNISRNLYKNTYGNKVVFEEINEDLGLTFRYHWNSSGKYGFVKKSTLINNGNSAIGITVLDGIQNIMPHGVDPNLQNASSNLVDAYKKNELEEKLGLGIYALSAIIVDRAEPSEALKSTTVWSAGVENCTYLISSLQLENFRNGKNIEQEEDVKAEKGAYFICTDITIEPNTKKNWIIVAEVNQSIVDIGKISNLIRTENDPYNHVLDDVETGSKKLLALNFASDGIQMTADDLRNTRHFSNTLFNIMRGGIFDNNYQIEKLDFSKYVQKSNKNVHDRKREILDGLPNQFPLNHLQQIAATDSCSDFKRLAFEYMPLRFSRRHGDPSRPWNKFSINTENEIGEKILDYEGNWRDIFQNWEALAHSYPAFIEGMIHKFLNATTFDGYNPYRVTKDGFDWESEEPDNPWSYIGYWGDHQIIYLLKFLEFMEQHYPRKLSEYFNEKIFVYANVPYKIKSYQDILTNPKDTIVFDEDLDRKIREDRLKSGADAALLTNENKVIHHVNLLEKLLATSLAKVSNFIPEGGIWMNTQRPEWNDANNALVGNGVSMVTLCYLRRFLNFFEEMVENAKGDEYHISKELIEFFKKIRITLTQNISILSGTIPDKARKKVLDGLGNAGSEYRRKIYKNGFSNNTDIITKSDVLEFIRITLQYFDHSIDANKRSDDLFHSYNLMTLEGDNEISISHLSEMLEGQVAVLSSGYISCKEALKVLDALKSSSLFRHDQYSYILYPDKKLPKFVEKNNIPSNTIKKSELVQELLKSNDTQIVETDNQGNYHFNASFNNAESLKKALLKLPEKYNNLVEKDRLLLLRSFEAVFNHKAFTGRSGTFFGYEGLGSIYWHMVSKLLLAVQENCIRAIQEGESNETISRLFEHYYEINEGIGVHKSPELYGAFPTDPYSHTPAGKGVQQPGMTGQVKEDILSRFGELGVFVEQGKLVFKPYLLRKSEFIKNPSTFEYIKVSGEKEQLFLEKDSLGFTYCQVPIIYTLSNTQCLHVHFNDNTKKQFDHLHLDTVTSQNLFERTGAIKHMIVYLQL